MNRIIRTIYCTIVLAAMLLARPASCVDTFNAAAIKVDTQIVSIREVEIIFSDSYKLIQDRLRAGAIAPTDMPDEIRKAWGDALDLATQDNIIDQLADKERKDIVHYYIQRYGQDVSAAKIKETFDRAVSDCVRTLRRELIAAAGGEDELRSALKRRGQTMDEWERNLTRELFRRDVLSMRLGPILRSPAAAKAYYEKHPDDFKQPDAWQLRRIRIAKSDSSTIDIALEKARMVRDKINANAGANFPDIAAKISDDPQYAKGGGLLTRGGKTELPSGNFLAEEKIAATLKDGELSQPIDAGDWFVIVQRAGYRPASTQTLEQAFERAEGLAFQERLKEKKKELFDKLKRDTYIEVLQKDPPDRIMKLAKPEAAEATGTGK